ncbi:hypothetical protein FBU59_006124 [Linderina macrospora]|uniref:Uncharacterized protein n=1 Tax=Linderina macrospora TaxID=4868 RepID=A0ACC1J106_9FUNG|nr:hypothetical protein FBU59_006124 [Linderina macrospora]
MVNWVKDTFTHLGICFSFPLLNSFPFSILVRPWKRGYDAVAAYAIESVDMRRKYLASHRDKPVDLLQTIIDAVDPESKTRMTERQVQAECLDMLLAGSETGASTMMWTIHLLMLHPQYYRRVVDEVHIFVSIAGAHNNPAVWAHPLVYNPERFINNQEAKRNLFTFGSGVRICPGRHLAVLEMMSILANMIKDYDMAVPEDYVRRGPNVLDENGNPKLMESLQFLAAIPVNPKRDCRLIITRQTE